MDMRKDCPFCDSQITPEPTGLGIVFNIRCPRCGIYRVSFPLFITIDSSRIQPRQRMNASSWLYENQVYSIESREDVESLFTTRTPTFHERADKLLLTIERKTVFAGQPITFEQSWLSLSWSFNQQEFTEIINYLQSETKRIECLNTQAPFNDRAFKITPEGWQYLEKLKRTNVDSRQVFVAMWFDPEMHEVYEKAIKPAIEYIEEGEKTPRFKAIKIDNVEHNNDINDEIIAQIRRSRFMVCDLTGYRGGVYFEAGLAFGLGMNVIYTCRKDWIKDENLKDKDGTTVVLLYDNAGRPIKIRKEGVHFDLAHRNRIEWSADKLDDFIIRLRNRIRATV